MKPPPKNVAASVRARLLELAKANKEDFTYVLTRYALERLLVRLSNSPHREVFVLKGAMLFRVWSPKLHRPTKDLDLLGFGSPAPDRMAAAFLEIIGTPVDDDGIEFDRASVRTGRIKEGAEYEGVRVELMARLGSARLRLQVDVGFGDAVTPAPLEVDYPPLLGKTAPRLRAYPRETVVAEKVHAMVQLGLANSRMKDFFDLWFLATTFDFEGSLLVDAIHATFTRRGSEIPTSIPIALTAAFAIDDAKNKQWRAFLRKSGLLSDETSLDFVLTTIRPFVLPPLEAAGRGTSLLSRWRAGNAWDPGVMVP